MKKSSLITFIFFTLLLSFIFLSLGRSNGQTNSSSSSSSNNCILCAQVIPNCSSNEIFIPQTCTECAHCVSTSSTSSGCLHVQTDCVGDPPGCKSKFGIYDPKICKCVCRDSLSSSGNLTCAIDNDCPIGVCSSSGTFKNYSCGNGICNQIFYFADPCQFSQSSSGNSITLNKNFAGIWRSKNSKTITLKLCIKDQKLEGIVNIPGDIENGIIISQNIISNNEISITIRNKNDLTRELNLKLTDKRHLQVSIDGGQTFETRKLSLLRSCLKDDCKNKCGLFCCKENETCEMKECLNSADCSPVFLGCKPISLSSSSGENDCSSKGSCRGPNGTYLTCPPNTECSGLPAYGCYPPGCPVPICCSPDTRIKTTGEQKRIADIKKGELVLTDGGKAVKVKKVSKTPVKNHKVLKVLLNDGTILEISPEHPTADGRKLKDLKMGDILDGRLVVETKLIPYIYGYTYDILPDSASGNYYANGVLIGSTLYKRK